jgi:hypothetical protein
MRLPVFLLPQISPPNTRLLHLNRFQVPTYLPLPTLDTQTYTAFASPTGRFVFMQVSGICNIHHLKIAFADMSPQEIAEAEYAKAELAMQVRLPCTLTCNAGASHATSAALPPSALALSRQVVLHRLPSSHVCSLNRQRTACKRPTRYGEAACYPCDQCKQQNRQLPRLFR